MVLVASPSDFVIRLLRWHPCGHDRLYVNAADGQQLGWHDLAHKGCASRGSNSQPAGADHALAAAAAVAPGTVGRRVCQRLGMPNRVRVQTGVSRSA